MKKLLITAAVTVGLRWPPRGAGGSRHPGSDRDHGGAGRRAGCPVADYAPVGVGCGLLARR